MGYVEDSYGFYDQSKQINPDELLADVANQVRRSMAIDQLERNFAQSHADYLTALTEARQRKREMRAFERRYDELSNYEESTWRPISDRMLKECDERVARIKEEAEERITQIAEQAQQDIYAEWDAYGKAVVALREARLARMNEWAEDEKAGQPDYSDLGMDAYY